MSLEEMAGLWQKELIAEMRVRYPDDTTSLSDEQVALMCPLTETDYTLLKSIAAIRLRKQIVQTEKEISELLASIERDTHTIDEEMRADVRNELYKDISEDSRTVVRLAKELEKYQNELDELEPITLAKESEVADEFGGR